MAEGRKNIYSTFEGLILKNEHIFQHYKKTVYYRWTNFDGYKSIGNFFFPIDLSTDILYEHYRRINSSVICFWKFFIYLPTDWSVG